MRRMPACWALLSGFVAVLSLTGCAVPVEQVNGPNGQPAYVMKCSGMGRDRAACLKKAGELCPTGYSIVDDSRDVNGAVVAGNTVMVARRNYLAVSCK